MLNGLDLFSGYGGLSLALAPWAKPVAYCEIERYPQSILLSRMEDGGLRRAPIWDDVRTLDGRPWRGKVDIIWGGFSPVSTSRLQELAQAWKASEAVFFFNSEYRMLPALI